MAQPINDRLIWIDLEMTGLNPDIDVILEIATIITDNQLQIIAEGPTLIISQPNEKLELMDDWVRKQHTKTGLIDMVQKSTVSIYQAQEETLDFIAQYCQKNQGVLCGNSVYVDRSFLRTGMPELDKYMHYRIIDVSTIKEVIKRWYPGNPLVSFKKSDNHRALEDIKGSIAELAHYRRNFFIPTPNV